MISLSITGTSPTVLYLSCKLKRFENVQYVIKLAEECEKRIQRLNKNLVQEGQISSDVKIELRYIGKITEDNLKHVTHRKGCNIFSYFCKNVWHS